MPEADEAGRVDEQVEAEREQAEIDRLLGEQDVSLPGNERQETDDRDRGGRETPQGRVRGPVRSRRHAQAIY